MTTSCFPLARAAATGIQQDVLDFVGPKPRQEARALAAVLRRGALFETGVLAMLHELAGVLDAEIAGGTCIEARYDNSLEDVSDTTSWGRKRLTPEADRLASALAVTVELYATLAAVHDLLRAEKVLRDLRTGS